MKSLDVSEKRGLAHYVAHQAYYSLVGREFEWELMPLALDQKVGTVVQSPLGWGRLTGKIRRGAPLPETTRLRTKVVVDLSPPVPDELLYRVVDALEEIAKQTGQDRPTDRSTGGPTVATLIIGARNEEQLRQNLGAVGWTLTREQIAALDTASATTKTYPYWHQAGFTERNRLRCDGVRTTMTPSRSRYLTRSTIGSILAAPGYIRRRIAVAASALAQDVDTVRSFNRFYTRQIGVLQEKLLDSAFSLTEGRVLYEIGYHGDTGTPRATAPTAGDLAKVLNVDGGYLSRILQRFARRRLITRTTSEADARQAHLALTARGQAALTPLQQQARDEVAVMLQHLSATERERVVDAMRQIRQSLGGRGDGAIAESAPVAQEPGRAEEPLGLREHRVGDLGWIVSRQSALYAEEYGWTTEYEALAAEIVAQFLKTYDPARERCWVAERGATPVGAVMIVRQSDAVAKLRLLHVERAARGLGIGTRLVAECVRFSRAAGYKTITLWTQSNLLAARHLYEAAGFTCVSQEPHHSFGKDLVAETWELALSS
jgi:DNA-binding MarR family transcriptional regulator/GNAT superfamily N-acetyltransferase